MARPTQRPRSDRTLVGLLLILALVATSVFAWGRLGVMARDPETHLRDGHPHHPQPTGIAMCVGVYGSSEQIRTCQHSMISWHRLGARVQIVKQHWWLLLAAVFVALAARAGAYPLVDVEPGSPRDPNCSACGDEAEAHRLGHVIRGRAGMVATFAIAAALAFLGRARMNARDAPYLPSATEAAAMCPNGGEECLANADERTRTLSPLRNAGIVLAAMALVCAGAAVDARRRRARQRRTGDVGAPYRAGGSCPRHDTPP